MTTNLLLLTPQVPDKALRTRTTDTWGDTIRLNELNNNRCGNKGNLAKLQTGKTGRTIISYDMGANGAQSVDTLAIARADLLTSDSVAALVVRGATADYFAPSDITGITAWWDPSYSATVDANGGVSAWVDRIAAQSASQGTSANRPVLTRYDLRENLFWNSQPTTSGDVSSGLVSNVTYTSATSSDWANLFSTVAVFADNSATRIHYYNRVAFAARTYTFSVYIRMDDGTAPSFSGSADFSLVLNGSATTSGITTESLGGGLYRISKSVAGGGAAANFGLLKTGSNTAKGFKAQGFMLTTTSYSTYVATTTGPVISGIDASRALSFDGTNDYLQTSIAAAPSGGMWGAAYVRLADLASAQRIITAGNTNYRMMFAVDTSGRADVIIYKDSTNYLRRRSTAGDIVAGTGCVLSFTYDGGTASSGIKIYKNGVQIDVSSADLGSYTVPASGDTIGIGGADSSQYFRGEIGDVVYGQGSTISAGNRQALEAFLTTKYITTPLVTDYALAGNSGEDSKDYVSRFAASSSCRYFWVEMESSASSKFTHSKLFLGAALDLGECVDSYSCSRDDTQDDDFVADSGAVDIARGKPAPYSVRVTWRGDTITDAVLATFHDNVIAPSETRFGLWLITTMNHEILDGLKSLYVRLVKPSYPRKEKTDYNIIEAEFEEIPG